MSAPLARTSDPPLVRTSVNTLNATLREAGQFGEEIWRNVTQAESVHGQQQASGSLEAFRAAIVESPIRPFWISSADSIMFFRLRKRAFFGGGASGEGFIISRLPMPNPALIKWSAPCFIKISMSLAGLSFGSQAIESFTCCLNQNAKQELIRHGRRRVTGVDAAMQPCGTQIQDKADVLTAASGNWGTVGVNITHGSIFHIGYGWGSIEVDEAKNTKAYGKTCATANKLLLPSTLVEPPREMQQLYGILNAAINMAERPSCAASRTSASLERMTAGRDPDRHMVLPDGLVINEELNEPPRPRPIPEL